MKKILIVPLSVVWILIAQLRFSGVDISQAATISGLCITEPEFTNYNVMSLQDIRDFLSAKGGFMRNLFPDVAETGGVMVDAALEIYNAAQTNKINPRVLLTTLEKEKVTVTKVTRPADDVLKRLAGWDTGDTVIPLSQKSAREQIQDMAAQFRRDFYDRLSQCNSTLGGWQVDVVRLAGNTPGQETDAFGETVPVEPRDKSITTLYQYTPWVGVALGGGHRPAEPPITPAKLELVGGNGLFCQLWHQFGWQAPPGPLALSPQPPTLACAPTASRCISVNASGGTPGPDGYTWSVSNPNAVADPPTGADKQNVKIRPPANLGGFAGVVAFTRYRWGSRYASPGCCNSILGQDYDCQGSIFQACYDTGSGSTDFGTCGGGCRTPTCGGTPTKLCVIDQPNIGCGNCDVFLQPLPGSPPSNCTSQVDPVCAAQSGCGGLSSCYTQPFDARADMNSGYLCDKRTQDMTSAGCRPCAPEMQGAVVTVTDSAGASVSTAVTAQ